MTQTQINSGTPTSTFTEETLPIAIGNLFKMNNYNVEYNVHIHGAQVDIVATSKGDPFSKPLYIEATIEYVSTEKYGKDTTKFLLLANKMPGCNLLCISSKGFTAPVKERAKESGVSALSYDELFAKFEKFTPYLDNVLKDASLQKLMQTYEEPLFNDAKGTESATNWLAEWKRCAPEEAKWLIVLGEYGTGKTSLTRVLQLRWLSEYHSNPSAPIPVRIELRNFSRQFDAHGLLHHFLDTNGLGHVPLEFMTHLIRTGRVILLLDGYDEMAQFMNGRERRACLSALAELANDGAKGILTSRPNYFSEAEELNVFEALYRKLEQQEYYLSRDDAETIFRERAVDNLIERYVLDRYERSLQDLSPEQTEALVKRSLQGNPEGQKIVLSILNKVFREELSGNKLSLSGKPVIIAYLLELVSEFIKDIDDIAIESLTEWQVYKLIIDRLMMRDFTRSPLSPAERRMVLHELALKLSSRGVVVATEDTFTQIIDEKFAQELRRLPPDERRMRRTELFEDLRSSATLTRAIGTKEDGWVFSHNSLREFLAVESLISRLLDRNPLSIDIPVSEAMRSFVTSMPDDRITEAWGVLGEFWAKRTVDDRVGTYLVLLWNSATRLKNNYEEAFSFLGSSENRLLLNDASIQNIDFSDTIGKNDVIINGSNSILTNIQFDGLNLDGSDFSNMMADNVSYCGTNLSSANFESCFLSECDFSGATVCDANFKNMDTDSSIIVPDPNGRITHLSGKSAIGYLGFHGAQTSPVENIFIYVHHPKFPILKKICEKLSEQRNSQRRGLTQRGEARNDPPFARDLVERLENLQWVATERSNLVSVTARGRPFIQRLVSGEEIADELVTFLNTHPA